MLNVKFGPGNVIFCPGISGVYCPGNVIYCLGKDRYCPGSVIYCLGIS